MKTATFFCFALLSAAFIVGCDDNDIIVEQDEPQLEYKFIPKDPENYWISEHGDTLYFPESKGDPKNGTLLEFKSETYRHNFDLPYTYKVDDDSIYVNLRQIHSSNSYSPLIGYPVRWGDGEFTLSFYQGREQATYKRQSLADFENAPSRPLLPALPEAPAPDRVTEDPWSWVNEANDTIYFSGSPDGKPEPDGGILYFKNMAFNPISIIPYRYAVGEDTLYIHSKQYFDGDTNNPLVGYPVEWGENMFTLHGYQGIERATYKRLIK